MSALPSGASAPIGTPPPALRLGEGLGLWTHPLIACLIHLADLTGRVV